jgi:hypothetical protein
MHRLLVPFIPFTLIVSIFTIWPNCARATDGPIPQSIACSASGAIAGSESSPVIVSIAETSIQVAAYTYEISLGGTETRRAIEVDFSTDDGTTWTVSPNSVPVPSGLGTTPDMDEPQLTVLHGRWVMLVFRAWKHSEEVGNGNSTCWMYHGQPGSIFYNSGIYCTICTDPTTSGNSWSTYSSGGTATAGLKTLATLSGIGTTVSTLEHPRVSCRPDFVTTNNYACITWEQRTYSKHATSDLDCNGNPINTFAGSSITSTIEISVVSNNPSDRGYVYPHGSDLYSIYNPSGLNPMRPSVTMAPDGTFWISYYNVSNYGLAEANYYIDQGTISVVSGDVTLAFRSTNLEIGPAPLPSSTPTTFFLPGTYDDTRGYFYSTEYKMQDGVGNALDGSNGDQEFNVDLAQGPSIQAVMNDYPGNCSLQYHIGVVFSTAYTQEVYSTDGGATFTRGAFNRPLRFWSWIANGDPSLANSWAQELVQTDPSPSISTSDPALGDYVDHYVGVALSLNGTDHNMPAMNLFPVLKYTLSHFISNPDLYVSNFTLSSVYTLRCAEDPVNSTLLIPENLDFTYDECAVSFDNISFQQIALAEIENWGHAAPPVSTRFWGNRIDVAGEEASASVHDHGLFLHPIWHEIVSTDPSNPSSVSEGVYTNSGGAFMAQGRLANYPSNDQESYITSTTNLFTINGSIPSISPYYWTGFDNVELITDGGYHTSTIPPNRPTSIVAASTYTSPTADPVVGGFTNYDIPSHTAGNDFTPSLPSGLTYIPYGAYYANYQYSGYNSTSVPTMGDLGYSDQRKIVMTGVIAHSVFVNGNAVEYSMSPDGGASWTQPIQLEGAVSGITQRSPSIAVYEQSDGNEFNGLASVAVTWVDVSAGSSYVYIKTRIREFDMCKGIWNPWSPIYTVNAQSSSHFGGGDDFTIPVIAPLVTSQTTAQILEQTWLLGWTITWTGPTPSSTKAQLQSRTWLRADATSGLVSIGTQKNTYWGQYPSTAILVPPSSSDANKFPPPTGSTTGIYPISGFLLSFPSVVCDENKTDKAYSLANADYYAQDVVISSNIPPWGFVSSPYGNGVFGYRLYYDVSGSIGGPTGQIWNPANDVLKSSAGVPYYLRTPGFGINDRNASVTVNSTGQRFAAWEEMTAYASPPPGKPSTSVGGYSSIVIAQSDYSGQKWWPAPGATTYPYVMYTEGSTDQTFTWLLNPSLTAYPKTAHINSSSPSSDEDFGVAEVLFWKQRGTNPNSIFFTQYSELPGASGKGTWSSNLGSSILYGQNTEASFSPYSLGSPGGTSLFEANSVSSLLTWTSAPVQQGSYKGTFDTIQPYSYYRSEMRNKDSLWYKFIFGDVFVNDSSTSNYRQVMLHYEPDTSGFSSFGEERDSVFLTEWFDVPIGAQINYYRGILFPEVLCDSVHNSLTDSTINVNYVIQLIHASGLIDTLENLTFTPGSSTPLHPVPPQYIFPKNAHSAANLHGLDTVQIRVKATIVGFQDVDSLVSFGIETALDKYFSVADTNVAYKYGSTAKLESGVNEFTVAGPFPNPAGELSPSVSALLHLPAGLTAKVEVLDILGRVISVAEPLTGTGDWRRVNLSRPSCVGSYFLHIVAGNNIRFLPFTVMK